MCKSLLVGDNCSFFFVTYISRVLLPMRCTINFKEKQVEVKVNAASGKVTEISK